MNVHRVQLDFAPSMEDELELRGGQLVRLLHEYDDGWALCVRLDRSQQGVVPRSCLSARPVKPRARPPPGAGPGPVPRGPPGGPGAPMMGPPGHGPQSPRFYPGDGGRPASPSSRPRSPAQGPYGPPPPHAQPQRPMSPAQFPAVPRSHSPAGPRQPPPRSMSPGPYGPPGMRRPQMPAANQRQRSNSTGAPLQNPRTAPGLGSSPLAGPIAPPPASALPAIPTNAGPAPASTATPAPSPAPAAAPAPAPASRNDN
ncbi:SH3 domain protein [Aspergillus stella-maris]|uniref:SH3 domain protein n=1 Tax=Aspergillus stella-maris TaxID=1810926 RepID=UPI003CCDC20D